MHLLPLFGSLICCRLSKRFHRYFDQNILSPRLNDPDNLPSQHRPAPTTNGVVAAGAVFNPWLTVTYSDGTHEGSREWKQQHRAKGSLLIGSTPARNQSLHSNSRYPLAGRVCVFGGSPNPERLKGNTSLSIPCVPTERRLLASKRLDQICGPLSLPPNKGIHSSRTSVASCR